VVSLSISCSIKSCVEAIETDGIQFVIKHNTEVSHHTVLSSQSLNGSCRLTQAMLYVLSGTSACKDYFVQFCIK